jgi:hypothetical protein
MYKKWGDGFLEKAQTQTTAEATNMAALFERSGGENCEAISYGAE